MASGVGNSYDTFNFKTDGSGSIQNSQQEKVERATCCCWNRSCCMISGFIVVGTAVGAFLGAVNECGSSPAAISCDPLPNIVAYGAIGFCITTVLAICMVVRARLAPQNYFVPPGYRII